MFSKNEEVKLANHKSAIKRAKQNEVRRLRNKAAKTRMKNIIKSVRLAISENSREKAVTELNTAQSTISKVAKKGVIHKRNAARTISCLSKAVNSISA